MFFFFFLLPALGADDGFRYVKCVGIIFAVLKHFCFDRWGHHRHKTEERASDSYLRKIHSLMIPSISLSHTTTKHNLLRISKRITLRDPHEPIHRRLPPRHRRTSNNKLPKRQLITILMPVLIHQQNLHRTHRTPKSRVLSIWIAAVIVDARLADRTRDFGVRESVRRPRSRQQSQIPQIRERQGRRRVRRVFEGVYESRARQLSDDLRHDAFGERARLPPERVLLHCAFGEVLEGFDGGLDGGRGGDDDGGFCGAEGGVVGGVVAGDGGEGKGAVRVESGEGDGEGVEGCEWGEGEEEIGWDEAVRAGES